MAAAQETVQCTIYAGKHLQTDATSTFGTLKCDAYIKVLTCVIDRSKWRDSESAGTTLVKNSSSPHAWKQQTPRSVVLSKCAIPKGGIIKVRLECWNKTDDYSGKARVKHLLGCADITFDKDSVAGDFLYGWVQLDQAQVPHAAIQVAVGLAPYTVTTTQLDAQKYVGGSKVKKPLTKVKVRRKPEVPRKVTKKKKKKHLTVGTGKVVPAVNTKTPRVGWGVTDKSVVFKPHRATFKVESVGQLGISFGVDHQTMMPLISELHADGVWKKDSMHVKIGDHLENINGEVHFEPFTPMYNMPAGTSSIISRDQIKVWLQQHQELGATQISDADFNTWRAKEPDDRVGADDGSMTKEAFEDMAIKCVHKKLGESIRTKQPLTAHTPWTMTFTRSLPVSKTAKAKGTGGGSGAAADAVAKAKAMKNAIKIQVKQEAARGLYLTPQEVKQRLLRTNFVYKNVSGGIFAVRATPSYPGKSLPSDCAAQSRGEAKIEAKATVAIAERRNGVQRSDGTVVQHLRLASGAGWIHATNPTTQRLLFKDISESDVMGTMAKAEAAREEDPAAAAAAMADLTWHEEIAAEPPLPQTTLTRLFEGCVICTSGLQAEEKKRAKDIVEGGGGQYDTAFHSQKVTYLVSGAEQKSGDTSKTKAAREHSIPIVSLAWLTRCVDAGMMLCSSVAQAEDRIKMLHAQDDADAREGKLKEIEIEKEEANVVQLRKEFVAASSVTMLSATQILKLKHAQEMIDVLKVEAAAAGLSPSEKKAKQKEIEQAEASLAQLRQEFVAASSSVPTLSATQTLKLKHAQEMIDALKVEAAAAGLSPSEKKAKQKEIEQAEANLAQLRQEFIAASPPGDGTSGSLMIVLTPNQEVAQAEQELQALTAAAAAAPTSAARAAKHRAIVKQLAKLRQMRVVAATKELEDLTAAAAAAPTSAEREAMQQKITAQKMSLEQVTQVALAAFVVALPEAASKSTKTMGPEVQAPKQKDHTQLLSSNVDIDHLSPALRRAKAQGIIDHPSVRDRCVDQAWLAPSIEQRESFQDAGDGWGGQLECAPLGCWKAVEISVEIERTGLDVNYWFTITVNIAPEVGAADVAAKTAHAVGFETAAQVLSSLGLTDAQLDAATREDANKAQLPIEVLVNVIVVVFADADGNFQPPVFVSATECDVDPTRGCEHASLVELVRICSTAHLYTVSKYSQLDMHTELVEFLTRGCDRHGVDAKTFITRFQAYAVQRLPDSEFIVQPCALRHLFTAIDVDGNEFLSAAALGCALTAFFDLNSDERSGAVFTACDVSHDDHLQRDEFEIAFKSFFAIGHMLRGDGKVQVRGDGKCGALLASEVAKAQVSKMLDQHGVGGSESLSLDEFRAWFKLAAGGPQKQHDDDDVTLVPAGSAEVPTDPVEIAPPLLEDSAFQFRYALAKYDEIARDANGSPTATKAARRELEHAARRILSPAQQVQVVGNVEQQAAADDNSGLQINTRRSVEDWLAASIAEQHFFWSSDSQISAGANLSSELSEIRQNVREELFGTAIPCVLSDGVVNGVRVLLRDAFRGWADDDDDAGAGAVSADGASLLVRKALQLHMDAIRRGLAEFRRITTPPQSSPARSPYRSSPISPSTPMGSPVQQQLRQRTRSPAARIRSPGRSDSPARSRSPAQPRSPPAAQSQSQSQSPVRMAYESSPRYWLQSQAGQSPAPRTPTELPHSPRFAAESAARVSLPSVPLYTPGGGTQPQIHISRRGSVTITPQETAAPASRSHALKAYTLAGGEVIEGGGKWLSALSPQQRVPAPVEYQRSVPRYTPAVHGGAYEGQREWLSKAWL